MIIEHPHVEVGEDGTARIRGAKVPVRRLWQWFKRGVQAETLIKRYPSLTAGQVLDALSFAFDNPEHIELEIARENAETCGGYKWDGVTTGRTPCAAPNESAKPAFKVEGVLKGEPNVVEVERGKIPEIQYRVFQCRACLMRSTVDEAGYCVTCRTIVENAKANP